MESEISDPAVWVDAARSQPLMRERKRLETLLSDDNELKRRASDVEAYFDLAREGESVEPELESEIRRTEEFIDQLEPCTRAPVARKARTGPRC